MARETLVAGERSRTTGRPWYSATRFQPAAGVNCETVHVEHDHPYQAIIDTAGAMRSYRHGLARPAWSICDHAGQRNSQSADSWRRSGSCCPCVASGGILASVFCAVEMLSIENPLWRRRAFMASCSGPALRSLNEELAVHGPDRLALWSVSPKLSKAIIVLPARFHTTKIHSGH